MKARAIMDMHEHHSLYLTIILCKGLCNCTVPENIPTTPKEGFFPPPPETPLEILIKLDIFL